MRDILFRGKRLDNGEWVYGSFCPYTDFQGNKHARIMLDDDLLFEVDPATIGQFTGLTDKNGVQLSEGDIFHIGDRLLTYTVIWEDCGLKGKQNGSSCRIGLEYWKNAITIVGNVHDNQELLKGGEQ